MEKKSGKTRTSRWPFFDCIGAVLRGNLVERSVAGFLLGEFDGVERSGTRFREKKQIATFVDSADGYFNI